jgi:glycosyltransferase involved in cell wall biosynthesis
VSEPRISVVVCTHNRPARLAALLASLDAQALERDAFEVVVVDDGSTPPARCVLEERSYRLALKLIRNELPLGPAVGRNAGWRAARAPLLAFTDDDCTADPDWLSAGLEAAARSPGAIIQGRTEPDSGTGGLLTRTVSVAKLGPHFETCNIFYPRTVLERLGGFDESYGSRPAAEDTDLAWRAIEAGTPAEFAEDAVIRHAVERVGVRGMLRVALRWTEAIRVYGEHPQVRSSLYRGVFWNVWHYLAWRSLLALAGPRWLRRFLITRYLVALRERAQFFGSPAGVAVPYFLLHDAVECYAVARGALRYRTLVL